ncbi:hypothetical protein B0J15DRAFT_12960 [Fusarium solani]|uniref:C2H2-type domain-containing protein n=1 Tax=Fusarium solani TaxID=169388 RepID=A0A9P9L710_FUSSL|nr:uncharacterized protein B0J15DRAFT_12960 [Fusarium solani]KAH7275356.1 hypothetical protein B0J15DRAFT_12960 [Fusarium solani]
MAPCTPQAAFAGLRGMGLVCATSCATLGPSRPERPRSPKSLASQTGALERPPIVMPAPTCIYHADFWRFECTFGCPRCVSNFHRFLHELFSNQQTHVTVSAGQAYEFNPAPLPRGACRFVPIFPRISVTLWLDRMARFQIRKWHTPPKVQQKRLGLDVSHYNGWAASQGRNNVGPVAGAHHVTLLLRSCSVA